MNPGELLSVIMAVVLPAALLLYLARRYFSLKEKQLEADTRLAADKAAEYSASNAQLERRVRVLEQIITDRGVQTATQIEALRDQPQRLVGDKVQ